MEEQENQEEDPKEYKDNFSNTIFYVLFFCASAIALIGLIAGIRNEPVIGNTVDPIGYPVTSIAMNGYWFFLLGIIFDIMFLGMYWYQRSGKNSA